jgi:hypothetical protein
MSEGNKGTYIGSGEEQLVRPMQGVRTTFLRPDTDYSVSNRAVVEMQKKEKKLMV